MKLNKCLKMAINMVVHSKLRSWLTIIGIVIGVASVITIVSIGEGLQKQVSGQLGGLGASIITITPGFSQAQGFGGRGGDLNNAQAELGRNDVQALRGIIEVGQIDVNIQGSREVYYLGKSARVSIKGVDQKVWHLVTQDKIDDGRILGPSDQNVVVIGYKLAKEYFDESIGVNKVITIAGRAFRVVGILEESTGFGGGDTTVIMPLHSAYEILEDKTKDVYDSITVKAREGSDIDLVVEKIEKKLMIIRHVTEKEKDFTVVSMKQIQQQITDITGTITVFLGAIAAVALIVGAVGIANTMFTSVLEKTKEIGIMKAIGARNKDILFIFLFNSGLMGLIGGLIGVIFGFTISKAIPFLMPAAADGSRMVTSVSIQIVLIALTVSVSIGMISGVIPAYSGSKLRPVDALRYE
jgi:putative ABC transport system permease protein